MGIVCTESSKYTAYRKSGERWLGDIPSHWTIDPGFKIIEERCERNIGLLENTVLSLSYGSVIIKPEEKLTGLIPESFETYQIAYPGDIIIRPTDLQNDKISLRTGLVKHKGIITSAYITLKVKENYSTKYCHYFLYLVDLTKVIYGLGTGLRQNLSFRDFRRFKFPVPPLSEQTAIANFLDQKTVQIDRAIAQKERLIELLKERRQILIHKAVTRGLNPDVKMKDSGVEWIGEIPEHWEVKKIKHVTTKIGSGVTPSGGATTYLDSGVPLLRSQNILFDKIDLNGVAFIDSRVHESMQNSQVQKGDVLLNITGGSIGRCHFVELDRPLNVNQHVCIIRPTKRITTLFLNSLLASEVGQGQIWFFQQGGGREGLNFQAIKNFFLPLPPMGEQLAISDYIQEISKKFSNVVSIKQQQIQKLKEYKASLIDAAVTGKIKVSM